MKNKLFQSIPLLCLLLAICVFALLPLFHPGYFTMHDDEQVARLQQMYLVLSQGQIPPRWIPDLGFGFGYPLFNFYPPLVYYLGSLSHLVGISFINSTKLVMGMGFLGAAIAMFVWVRKHFGVIAGLFAALLYTYAPYHSVDVYVRGALSEFFSWIFIPLIFWAIDTIFETQDKKSFFLLALFFGLLMISHSLVMLQLVPFFLFYIVVRFFITKQKQHRVKSIIFVLLAVSLGLGLTAYFWLPSILEKQYTLVDTILTRELANYVIHFVCPQQLWSSPWGYGGSVAGCVDGLSFQIGKIQTVVGIVGVILSISFFIKKKKRVSAIVAVIFLLSIFFVLPYSKPLWDVAKPFWYIQFPWRYLLFVALGSAFLGGFVLYILEKKFGVVVAIITAVLLSFLAMYQVRNDFKPQSYRMVTDAQLTSAEDIRWRVSSMSYEYVPKEVATRLSLENTTELAIDKNQLPQESFTTLSPMKVVQQENLSTLKKYVVNVYNTKTQKSGVFQINTYVFPGWEIWVDNKRVTNLINNRLDLIQIQLPTGQHVIVAQFVNTPIRTIANIISLVSIAGGLVLLFWRKQKYL